MNEKNEVKVIAEPGKQDIVTTRVLNAPPDVVFRVMTDPQYIPDYWGPRRLKTVVDKMDVRPGGQWRYIQSDEHGHSFGFHGVYHEVTSNRTVSTFEFEGMPGHVLLETATFEPLPGGKTLYTGLSIFQSVADRDGMIQSGMEHGQRELFERLDEVLQTVAVK